MFIISAGDGFGYVRGLYRGNDIETHITRSLHECAGLCDVKSTCTHFSWAEPGAPRGGHLCWLKNGTEGSLQPEQGIMSGW